MLVGLNTLLARAQAGGYAVGAFNTYNLEITRAILNAAETQRAPIIVQVGSGALKYAGYHALLALALAEARRASVPVAVHLDHSTDPKEIALCIELGCTSVMIDGSRLPFAENVALTCQVVQLAHARGVAVEAELGSLPGQEDQADTTRANVGLTVPAQAEAFVCATGVDALAVAVGNVHGFYRGEPRLDVARLAEIQRRVDVPLVLHGGSGLPRTQIETAIAYGVRKFNVNTELRVAFFEALTQTLPRARPGVDLPALFEPSIAAMQQIVEERIEWLGSVNQA